MDGIAKRRLQYSEGCFVSWGSDRLGPVKSALGYEPLRLARVVSCSIRPSHHRTTRVSARASPASLLTGPMCSVNGTSCSFPIAVCNQSVGSFGPHDVKPYPWAEVQTGFEPWSATLWYVPPCRNPLRVRKVLCSSCHPPAAGLVPYMCLMGLAARRG